MASKRDAEAVLEPEVQIKRLRQFVDKAADEFTCAITHELPFDPVIAEDGRVYERRAIEKWIKETDDLKSPLLNTPMGPKLLPATQTRNVIEQMVRSGAIDGTKAEEWLKKHAEEEKVKEVRARAEGGDGDAMHELGTWYYQGRKGLTKDFKQAIGWLQRGHELGHATCTNALGVRYTYGQGVKQDKAYAMSLYGIAAGRGSENGCHNLARCLARGMNGVRKNVREATRWYRAMENAAVRDADESFRITAAEWLREHAVDL